VAELGLDAKPFFKSSYDFGFGFVFSLTNIVRNKDFKKKKKK
jgi:hypothetical protein